MKYTISEFAELLGVTTDTLRFYERYEIIKPFKDNKNNYRYFKDMDARNLLMSRWYRSMDISIQKAAHLTRKASLADITVTIREKQRELEEEIRIKTMLLNKIKDISADLTQVRKNLNHCLRMNLPGIYRIRQTDKNDLLKDAALPNKVEEWMKLLPYAFFSFRINNKDLLTEDGSFDYNWGLALFESDIRKLNIKVDDSTEYIKPGSYISSIITSCGEDIKRDSLEFMFTYIIENKYTINGNIFGRIITAENTGTEKRFYLEVYIPVN